MLTKNHKRKFSIQQESLKLEKIRFIYSSRAEKLKYPAKRHTAEVKKFSPKRTIYINLPGCRTEFSRENLCDQIINKSMLSTKYQMSKRKKIVFKSELEKVYSYNK